MTRPITFQDQVEKLKSGGYVEPSSGHVSNYAKRQSINVTFVGTPHSWSGATANTWARSIHDEQLATGSSTWLCIEMRGNPMRPEERCTLVAPDMEARFEKMRAGAGRAAQ